MNTEPNPYAPPLADPAAPRANWPDTGALWCVADGHLEVRNMASLPDVCLYGYSADDGGSRVSLQLSTQPSWLGPLLWLPIWMLILWSDLDSFIVFAGILGSLVLSSVTGKKVRIMVYRSKKAARMALVRGIVGPILVGVAVYHLLAFQDDLGLRASKVIEISVVVLIFLVVSALRFLPGRGPTRVRASEDSWFEVRGLSPETVGRLEEVQRRSMAIHPPA